MRSLPPLAALALLIGAASPAQAGPGHAHEHGVTHLDIVLDGAQLALDLQAAGHHIVGFEHAPAGVEQETAWAEAERRLGDAQALFALPAAAGCRLVSARAIPPGGHSATADERGSHKHDHDHRHGNGHGPAHGHDHDKQDGHDHHAHGHGDHDHARHAHAHAGHDHDQHPEHGDHAGHGDWRAQYRYSCANPAALGTIEPALFRVFPGTEEVRFQLLAPAGQAGGSLAPGRTRIEVPQGR